MYDAHSLLVYVRVTTWFLDDLVFLCNLFSQPIKFKVKGWLEIYGYLELILCANHRYIQEGQLIFGFFSLQM